MYDVTIVGAGPVGLFLATELGLAGCSVLVLERDAQARSPWKAFPLGMRGLNASSVRAFERRGMRPEQAMPTRGAGHFAGIMADLDVAGEGLLTSLEAVESMLAARAAALGVEIRRGAAVSALSVREDSVLLTAGGQEHAARWVVGCDGGRSTVRNLAGFDFVGTEPLLTGYLMLADIADPEKLSPGFNLTPTGMYLRTADQAYVGMLDFDGGAFDRSRQPDREHLQAVLRRVSGTGVTLTGVRLVSTFTDRAMQATTYRRGRVLLAGDAAHIHSPLGAQGLNLGLGDALTLGALLAETVRGEDVLDSYTRQRHPVGARALDWTRAQAAIMRPDPHSQAIQAVVRDLIATHDGATYVYQRTAGA